ncbi:hypothetical protein DAETH_30970 [Deinococcus aetherius]|uniref:Lipoprotein n=1 Tax=Deinococcus aetherius TaxID=200252 RepID=A0ABN6RK38_9DEIO|nr:hypothetical protein [Deinococcus aetherius]BDP43128.1 hypothetical protein DAETH_30970 [Deinococcus aetherius]
MKYPAIVGVLLLGLVSCGGGGSTPPDGTSGGENPGGGTSGGSSYPYNPGPSAVESSDSRVPYYGDWVWAVRLLDGSYRLGALSVTQRGMPTARAKNGGVGEGFVCADANCTTVYDGSYGVISTFLVDGQPKLSAIFGNATRTANRLGILDSDDKVAANAQGHAVIAGSGTWVQEPGTEGQPVKVAFVQVDATPDMKFGQDLPGAFAEARAAADAVVTAQQVSSVPLLAPQRMLPSAK